MPWKVSDVLDERMRFVILASGGTVSMTEACHRFGVSRETGYKWLGRYRLDGPLGLAEGSRARLSSSACVPAETAAALLALRQEHPHWGPKKLRAFLLRAQPDRAWPAASTIGDLLKRHGLVGERRVRTRGVPRPQAHTVPTVPNDVWGIDFKGWFRTADGRRCDPLTVSDSVSRYLLVCQIVPPTLLGIWPVCQRLFATYGQPRAFRMDNGSPFGSQGAAGLTRLTVLWLKLGIALEPITPGCPGENGRHERMHRTLKRETASPPAASVPEQQVRFDRFRSYFNQVRPHEALSQRTPASVHTPNGRCYTGQLRDPWYDADHQVYRVLSQGHIRWTDAPVYISEALCGELVGVAELASGDHVVRFAGVDLGVIVGRTGSFVRFSAPWPGTTRAARATATHDAASDACQHDRAPA